MYNKLEWKLNTGMFCNESGLTQPVGFCAEGWYCSSCSWTSKPPSFDSVGK